MMQRLPAAPAWQRAAASGLLTAGGLLTARLTGQLLAGVAVLLLGWLLVVVLVRGRRRRGQPSGTDHDGQV
jgi:hypothetical protein